MCIFRFSKKHHLVCFLSLLNYGDIGSVLIKHLQIVIPLSYPCHYTNLCPHKPHKPAHTHTHTHTHTCLFLWKVGTSHRCNGFYTVQTVWAVTLHLNLALTGDCAFLLSPQKNSHIVNILCNPDAQRNRLTNADAPIKVTDSNSILDYQSFKSEAWNKTPRWRCTRCFSYWQMIKCSLNDRLPTAHTIWYTDLIRWERFHQRG